MAKNGTAGNGKPVKRETTGNSVEPRRNAKAAHRVILFPTEPSTIGHKKIDRAIERVISRRK